MADAATPIRSKPDLAVARARLWLRKPENAALMVGAGVVAATAIGYALFDAQRERKRRQAEKREAQLASLMRPALPPPSPMARVPAPVSTPAPAPAPAPAANPDRWIAKFQTMIEERDEATQARLARYEDEILTLRRREARSSKEASSDDGGGEAIADKWAQRIAEMKSHG